jgi:hypothetical protein
MNCEEPNFSSDDRCNAPVIRRKGSALLFLAIFHISQIRILEEEEQGAQDARDAFRWDLTRLAEFHGYALPVSLASLGEPFAHGRSQPRGFDAEPGLELPFSGRQRVIEFSRPRKVPHAEAIEPFKRRSPALAANHDLRQQFSRVHFAEV